MLRRQLSYISKMNPPGMKSKQEAYSRSMREFTLSQQKHMPQQASFGEGPRLHTMPDDGSPKTLEFATTQNSVLTKHFASTANVKVRLSSQEEFAKLEKQGSPKQVLNTNNFFKANNFGFAHYPSKASLKPSKQLTKAISTKYLHRNNTKTG